MILQKDQVFPTVRSIIQCNNSLLTRNKNPTSSLESGNKVELRKVDFQPLIDKIGARLRLEKKMLH